LKKRIRRVGTSPTGIPIYSFRYIWGGPRMVGTMAQDLLSIRPDAVIQTASGYYMVDYDKLDIRMEPVGRRHIPGRVETGGVANASWRAGPVQHRCRAFVGTRA
jgi:hypothetical protein